MNLELARNGRLTPEQLRQELQQEQTSDLKRRRGVITWSLVGTAGMTAVTSLQTGIIKHLPDPPFGNFDSDRVTRRIQLIDWERRTARYRWRV